MYNLYDNSFLMEDAQKKYISIPLEQMNESHPELFLLLNKFLKSLIDYPDILYKIIKCSNEKDLSNSFLLFITNNLFNDILSTEIIPLKLLIIIEKLLYEKIKNISNKKDLISFITNSKISKLLFGFKYFDEVQIYFNLLIGDIIENYENSGMNTIPLIFKINELFEYIRIKEEILNKELYSEKEFKREEAKRKKNDEKYTLNNIYKMKFKSDDSTSSSSISGLFSVEEEEDLNNEMNNSEIFMAKYAPELNKKELNEIINKYSDNEYIQYYLKNQLSLLEKNDNLFGNSLFFGHIQVLKDSEKILYYYQRNFNIVREILLKIYQNYKKTTHLIPYSIKCISRIIFNLIKLKFPELKKIEINKYIKILFFNIIFEQFILYSDYSTLMSTTIISEETKHNLKVIFAIWKKFIYGTFFTNDKEQYSDYTPFNWFFIDIMEENIGFSEKIIDVNMPECLLRNNINEDNNNLKNLEILGNKNKLFYSYSSCFTIDNILTLIKIINSNKEVFFKDKENPINEELKKCIMNIKINENILLNIKDKENNKNINYYIYYEIFYEHSNIFYENEQLEIDNQKIEENNEILIEKIKKNLSNLLFNTDLTIIKNNKNINLNNLKQILKELDKILKIESYLTGNNEDDNIDNECLINVSTDMNVIKELNIQNELNISSLIILLDHINEKYSKNNYKLFFDSLFDEISTSINKYDFELLSPFLDKLKIITKNKNIYLINQEKYKHIFIHSKLRNFIDNEQIEVEIKFKYNENEKYFSISKKEKMNKRLNDKKDKPIICHTIPDFFRKFPNLSKLQLKKEVDLLSLKNELNIKSGLLDYFHIVKEHLITKFDKQEIKVVYPKIKKRIFVKLYNKLFPKEPDDDDLTFHYKCLCLSWIQPKHLNNQIDIYNDNFINIISNLFNQMNVEKSYSGKLELIEKIFGTINNILKINKGDNYSTDDIAPICEYALIKAKPERLSSNLKFIEIMMSENSSNLSKMHFDYLKNYMITIKNCNYEHFYGIKEEDYNQNCLKAKNSAFETNS